MFEQIPSFKIKIFEHFEMDFKPAEILQMSLIERLIPRDERLWSKKTFIIDSIICDIQFL